MLENDKKEQRSKEERAPSEMELQEERMEDDLEAKRERAKHLQYLSDACLRDQDPSLLRYPGSDNEGNSPSYARGLRIDYESMQAILDSNRSILMTVDHGLEPVCSSKEMVFVGEAFLMI
eukprot:gene23772-30831_t